MESDRVLWRTSVLTKHLTQSSSTPSPLQLESSICLEYSPPELSAKFEFDTIEMRKLLDGHNITDRDWLFGIIRQSNLFCPKKYGGRVFVSPDYNQSMEQQREVTMKRIEYLMNCGVFNGWLTDTGVDADMRKFALHEVIGMYDHSLNVKLGVHFFLWIKLTILCASTGCRNRMWQAFKARSGDWRGDEKHELRRLDSQSALGYVDSHTR